MPAPKAVGSRRITSGGYVQIKTKADQRRWPFEHRVIWEAANGPIPLGHYVHHINGIKTDNRIENLALCSSNSEHHRKYHAEEHRERGRRVGLTNCGKPKTAEQRAKMSAAAIGRKKSISHCGAMSLAQRVRSLRTNPSGFFGVYRKGNRWVASLRVANKQVYLGAFATPREAADAVNRSHLKQFPGKPSPNP